MRPEEHTTSYYASSRNDTTLRSPLSDNIDVDVCIIGAGFTGLSSALQLVESGYSVAVLEASKIGFGASGRNGGQLINSYSRDIDVIEKRYGSDVGKALGDMAFEGGNIIRERIEKYAIDCDYRPGGIFAAITEKQLKELEEKQALWQRYAHDKTIILDQSQIQAEIQTDTYVGGMLDNGCGHFHPLNFVLGEAAAIESQGGQIFEQSPAISINRGEVCIVRTPQGQVNAKYLIIAGNAYLGSLVPELAAKSMPCGTQVVTTEPLGEETAKALIPNNYCVEDCNFKLDYYRLTGDNRLLFGGGTTYGGGDPTSIEKFLRPHLEKTFPHLKGVKLDYIWGGDFLLTLSRLPQFGRLEDNIYYAQGYSGHGVTSSNLAGKLIAEAMKGDSSRFDSFAELPHYPFPGGRLFRVPYTALGAFYYGLRDRLGI